MYVLPDGFRITKKVFLAHKNFKKKLVFGREQYLKEARDYLNEDATNDEIDEEIQNELEAWND